MISMKHSSPLLAPRKNLRLKSILIFSLLMLCRFSFSAEKLTADNVAALIPRLFELHLKQHDLDNSFMRHVLKEYLIHLDPSRTCLLKSEATEMFDLENDVLSDLGKSVLRGDLSYFERLMADFLINHVSPDDEFYRTLETHEAEIKGGDAHSDDSPPPAKPLASELEGGAENDKTQWREWPELDSERRQRIITRTANAYRFARSYLNEKDAFTLALQSARREHQTWLDMSDSERRAEIPKIFMKSFLNAMDPHTDYFDADEEEFTNRLERQFAGIGVQIRPCPLGAIIDEIMKDGPAEKCGKLSRGDQIVSVDGHALAGLPVTKIVKRIKGERGASVKLGILHGGTKDPVDISVTRDVIEMAKERVKDRRIQVGKESIGVISVQSFYRGVHRDVRDRLRTMERVAPLDGVVLDLRGNRGGYLDEAVGLAGLFIEGGAIVGERDGFRKVEWKDDPFDTAIYSGPLVVLANQYSASASEIVSGSLQDYCRAVIVAPTQTFGKGTVQRVIQLKTDNIPGEIKITTHQYFLAGGASVQLKGVQPDVQIPGFKLNEDALESANENPIPFNEIDGKLKSSRSEVKAWTKWKDKNLDEIVSASNKRVDDNPEFKKSFESTATDPEAAAGHKKDTKDLQADEAAAIAADMATTWPHLERETAAQDR
jgi:carboxyl-terminal processing protease